MGQLWDQNAQGFILPGLRNLQRWLHNLSGQLTHLSDCLITKQVFLITSVNLISVFTVSCPPTLENCGDLDSVFLITPTQTWARACCCSARFPSKILFPAGWTSLKTNDGFVLDFCESWYHWEVLFLGNYLIFFTYAAIQNIGRDWDKMSKAI